MNTLSHGRCVDRTAFIDRSVAENYVAELKRSDRDMILGQDEEYVSRLRASVLDLDPCDDGDVLPSHPAQAWLNMAYQYELEPCDDNPLCLACYEAGFLVPRSLA